MENSTLNINNAQGKFPTIPPKSTLGIIIQSIYNSYVPFINVLHNHRNPNLSSEKSLVQEFVIQNDIQLRKYIKSLRIEKEYTDNFYGTKGIPDFAYLLLEEGESHEPIFIVEVKILPAPDNITQREKEYVIGNKRNGGIERFKIGVHGIGLSYCGILGFINNRETIDEWKKKINSWIIEMSEKAPLQWSSQEILQEQQENNQVISLVKRESDNLFLHHFFITIE